MTLSAGISHDSNIFGSQTGAISSMVYEFAPKIAFNASLSEQTFASASYGLTIDHFDNRPGDKTLDSHDLAAQLDHAFSSVTTLHFSDDYSIVRNPQSLLSGVTLNAFDARFETNLAPQFGAAAKFQAVNYADDDNNLSTELDHAEYLFGVSASYDVLPELKAVGEFRHSDILYGNGGSTKDKHSEFIIGGVDYEVAKKVTASGRLGYEWRRRSGEANAQAPYVQMSLKYDYDVQSFVSAGYVYTFEENSDVVNYNDTKVNRLFFNLQHALSALLIASGSVDYEPSQLQGRRGVPNADETTTRFGLALTYLPAKNWRLTASYDYDNISSDVPARGQNRERTGLSATYTY